MAVDTEDILQQLQNLRRLFAEAAPTDPKVIYNYAWIIATCINRNYEQIGSVECRRLLADYLKLPVERPSRLHSAILSATIRLANSCPEFHFATFLRMWGVNNLRSDDEVRYKAADGKVFPSLAERTAKALAHSILLHPDDAVVLKDDTPHEGSPSDINKILSSYGYSIVPMLVTRVKETTDKNGRRYCFATLTSPDGIEVESIVNNLKVSPLHPLQEGRRHYVNIGQLYNVLLQSQTTVVNGELTQSLKAAYLSQQKVQDIFPTEIGYIEALDTIHGHMHIFDCHSRHFVAPILRFSKEKAGTFVRFIPVIPQTSKFKTAVIQATVPECSSDVQTILRTIRITSVNQEKGYAAWELTDKSQPIVEILSPLQLSYGETSPSFASGYISISSVNYGLVTDSHTIRVGLELSAFIYLKRGKDKQKRPHVAKLFRQHKNE